MSIMRKAYKETKSELLLRACIYTIIILFTVVTVYPFIHVASISFSSTAEAIRPGIHIFPLQFSIDAYRKVFRAALIWTGYKNTLIVTLAGTLLNMVFTILTAYPLSRKKFPFRNGFTFMIVFTMMFSGGLIPTYLLVKNLGMMNQLAALIFPGLVSAYNMVLMKNFFQTIPESLEESAKIDGANDIRVMVKIVLPLSAPVLATISLFYAVAHWNAFFDCLIYIGDQNKKVLQVILRQLVVTSEVMLGNVTSGYMDDASMQNLLPVQEKSTIIMVATIPILLVYPYLQKYFVKGVLIGSVKG